MASKQHGRRAANVKAKTPLTELSELLASNSGAFGRRAAVVAASGGLLTAAIMPAAGQGTDDEAKVAAESEKQAPVEFKNQTPTIDAGGSSKKGDQESSVTVDTDAITAEAAPKPKPKPKPKPEPKEEPEPTTAEPAPAEEPEEPAENSDDDSSDSPDAGSKDDSPKKDTGGSDDSGPIDGSKAEQVLGWAEKGVGTTSTAELRRVADCSSSPRGSTTMSASACPAPPVPRSLQARLSRSPKPSPATSSGIRDTSASTPATDRCTMLVRPDPEHRSAATAGWATSRSSACSDLHSELNT